MLISLYIGTELADFSEAFNVGYSVRDISSIDFGSTNRSYPLNLPLTRQNKKLLKFNSEADVKTEVTDIARLYLNDMLVISGRLIVQGFNDFFASTYIESDTWLDDLKDRKMSELDLSAHDHLLTHQNVEDSWSASYPAYRYPMIDFGGLQSGQSGASAQWLPTDFIPMISIKTLVEKIFEPYTIVSSWLSTAFIKDLFILAKETILSDEFVKGKELSADCTGESGNSDTVTVAASGSGTAILNNHVIIFSNETTDEGNDFNAPTGVYTVPETGTYRFKAVLIVRSNGNTSPFTETIGNMTLTIEQTGSASRTLKTVSAATIVNNSSHTLDSGYVHLVAGDEITVQASMYSTATNGGGVAADLTVDIEGTSSIELIWGQANRYSGLNKTIALDEMLPDMKQIDFLAAIRDIANLAFWFDKAKQNIYIEPWDSFISSTVIDLTSYIDFENTPSENISTNYPKSLFFRWKGDASDKAHEDYSKYNTATIGEKEVVLTSQFARQETEYRDHPFSSSVTGPNYTISDNTNEHVRIFAEWPIPPYIMFNRMIGFNTRLVEWKGLTALNWYYETELHNWYPKIAPVTWSDLYTKYWMKYFHYVDKGKLYTFRMKIGNRLNQFFTVVNSATSEGFRPTYKVTLKGVDHYFFLQKLTTDGNIAEIEMIVK